MRKRYLVMGVLLSMAVACRPFSPEEEETTEPPASPVATETSPAAVTFPPLATNTASPSRPVAATVTGEPALPNAQLVGGAGVGFQLVVPERWVNASAMLQQAASLQPLLPNALLLADTRATAERLLAGEVAGDGAFALAYFLPGESVPARDVEAALTARVAESNPAIASTASVVATTINGVRGAYADVRRDPFGALPTVRSPLRLRALMLLPEGDDTPIYFLFGTPAPNWPAQVEQFDAMMNTIMVHDLEVAATLPPQERPVIAQGTLDEEREAGAYLAAGTVDVWAFTATGGHYATVTVIPEAENLDLSFSVLTPAGERLLAVDDGYAGDTETITDLALPVDGRYFILVQELGAAAGPYRVALSLAPEPQFSSGGPIAVGQVLRGELPPGGEQQWHFSANAGQIFNIVLTPVSERLDAILELRGPTGEIIVSLDEGFSGDAEVISNLALPITGDYVIRVFEFRANGGPYTLSLTEGSEETANFHDAGDLRYGQMASESLQEHEVHAWFFSGLRGDMVTVSVLPRLATLDLFVWLLDPEIRRLAERDVALQGEAEVLTYTLPTDGEHVILVQELAGRSGDYDISLAPAGNALLAPAGQIAYGETVTATISAGTDVAWTFAGAAGDIIVARLVPTAEGDPVLLLRDPAGNVVARVNDELMGQAEQLSPFTLPVGGTWTVVVREFYDRGSGYTLRLGRLE